MKPTSRPVTVTLAALHDMHRKAAALVLADPVYAPIIEREIAAYDSQQDALSRARAIVAAQRAVA